MSLEAIRTSLPWLPEESFWQQNQEPLHDLFQMVIRQHPGRGAEILLPETEGVEPSPEAMRWMWQHFMGRQHGAMAGADGKIPLARPSEYLYWPDFNRIHYGDHYLTIPSKLDVGQEYTKAFILSGTQQENVDRLLAVTGHDPKNENVREIIVMSGQRLRGWEAPGEKSVDDLLTVTAQMSGADMERLRDDSPFVQSELTKQGLVGKVRSPVNTRCAAWPSKRFSRSG